VKSDENYSTTRKSFTSRLHVLSLRVFYSRTLEEIKELAGGINARRIHIGKMVFFFFL
jgi:hypothetical protein